MLLSASTLYRFRPEQGAELILIDNFSYGKMDNLEFEDHSFADEIIEMDIRDREGVAVIP